MSSKNTQRQHFPILLTLALFFYQNFFLLNFKPLLLIVWNLLIKNIFFFIIKFNYYFQLTFFFLTFLTKLKRLNANLSIFYTRIMQFCLIIHGWCVFFLCSLPFKIAAFLFSLNFFVCSASLNSDFFDLEKDESLKTSFKVSDFGLPPLKLSKMTWLFFMFESSSSNFYCLIVSI